MQFCEDDNKGCLVVPESMKFDLVVPSKLSKGKVLLFVKLKPGALKIDNLKTNVSIIIM